MSEPRDFETRTTPTGGPATEQFANAGTTDGPPNGTRTFAEAGQRPDPVQARQAGQGQAPQRLFADDETAELRRAWDSIQAGFVDEPRRAVEDADHLVAATMKRLAEIFADERERLEGQWGRGDDVSTEDLRVALQRYRSFFTRLLSV